MFETKKTLIVVYKERNAVRTRGMQIQTTQELDNLFLDDGLVNKIWR